MLPIKAALPPEASAVAQKLGSDLVTTLRLASRLATGEDLLACAAIMFEATWPALRHSTVRSLRIVRLL